jgi:hypothetical protein
MSYLTASKSGHGLNIWELAVSAGLRQALIRFLSKIFLIIAAMNKESIEDYVFSLYDKDKGKFEAEFLKEFKKCAKPFNNKIDIDKMLPIYSYLSKNHNYHGFLGETIYIGSRIFISDNLMKDKAVSWNKIYPENNYLVMEGADFELCIELIDSIKKAGMSYDVTFIETDIRGKKTGFIGEIK